MIAPHTILFTGPRIDAPGRSAPRFPAAAAAAARERIETAIDDLITEHHDVCGIAGGASGGDILFHEACIHLGVPSTVYLALPPALYARESVNDAGAEWTRRFNALLRELPHVVLQEQTDPMVWNRANRWMLAKALEHGGARMTLMVLGDDASELVQAAEEAGARVVRIALQGA